MGNLNFDQIMQIAGFIGTLFTLGCIPIILKKMDKHYKRDSVIGQERLVLDEADYKMTKYSRKLTRETAQAVKEGRSNGALTKAIDDFDKAYDILENETEKAIQKMKDEYIKFS